MIWGENPLFSETSIYSHFSSCRDFPQCFDSRPTVRRPTALHGSNRRSNNRCLVRKTMQHRILFLHVWMVDEGWGELFCCFVSVFFWHIYIFFVVFFKVLVHFQMPSATFKLPQNQPKPKSSVRCNAGEADSQPEPSGISIVLMD